MRANLVAPSTIAWSAPGTWVLLEGDPEDVATQARTAGLEASDPPAWPDAAHRGRISVTPGRVRDVAQALARVDGLVWLAEWGVGTVHVAAGTAVGLQAARDAATAAGGWLLREAGAPGLDGFGVDVCEPHRDRAGQGRVRPGRQAGARPPADPSRCTATGGFVTEARVEVHGRGAVTVHETVTHVGCPRGASPDSGRTS